MIEEYLTNIIMIEEYLTNISEMSKKIHSKEEFLYKSDVEFLLTFGRSFHNIYETLPKGILTGKKQQCFKNATLLTWKNPSYVYCEGLAIVQDLPFPLEHAWVYDKETQKIIDHTWVEKRKCRGIEYFGIPLKRSFVSMVINETSCYGIFGQFYHLQFAHLKGEIDKETFLEEI